MEGQPREASLRARLPQIPAHRVFYFGIINGYHFPVNLWPGPAHGPARAGYPPAQDAVAKTVSVLDS